MTRNPSKTWPQYVASRIGSPQARNPSSNSKVVPVWVVWAAMMIPFLRTMTMMVLVAVVGVSGKTCISLSEKELDGEHCEPGERQAYRYTGSGERCKIL